MGLRYAQTLTGVANGNPFPMDRNANPFQVGFGVHITGTITYTVQHTFDDLFDPTVTPVWYNHATIAAQTTDKDGNYAFPVTGIRIITTAGTGTAKLTVLQSSNHS